MTLEVKLSTPTPTTAPPPTQAAGIDFLSPAFTTHTTNLPSEILRQLTLRPDLNEATINSQEIPKADIDAVFKMINLFEKLVLKEDVTLEHIQRILNLLKIFLDKASSSIFSEIFKHDIKNVLSLAYSAVQLLIVDYSPVTPLASINTDTNNNAFLMEKITETPKRMNILARLHFQLARGLDWQKFMSSEEYIYLVGRNDIQVLIEESDKPIIAQTEFPVGFVFLILNELIDNSKQIASERRKPLAITIHFSISAYSELVVKVYDKSGGFEDLSLPPGETKRKGGTGKGMAFVHQMVEKAAGGKIKKENIIEDEKAVGAKITLIIPLRIDHKTVQQTAAATD